MKKKNKITIAMTALMLASMSPSLIMAAPLTAHIDNERVAKYVNPENKNDYFLGLGTLCYPEVGPDPILQPGFVYELTMVGGPLSDTDGTYTKYSAEQQKKAKLTVDTTGHLEISDSTFDSDTLTMANTITSVNEDGGSYKFVPSIIKAPEGSYELKILEMPPQYDFTTPVSDSIVARFNLPQTMEDNASVSHLVTVLPKCQAIGQGVVVNVNKHFDDAKDSATGATFEIYKYTGTDPIDQMTEENFTDKINDFAKVNNNDRYYGDTVEVHITDSADEAFSATNLPYGAYYIQEKSTKDGYLTTNVKKFFKITRGTTAQNVRLDNYLIPKIDKEITGATPNEYPATSPKYVNQNDKVNYTVTVKIPRNIKEYKTFKVTDTLPPYLRYSKKAEENANTLKATYTGVTEEVSDAQDTDPQTVTWTFSEADIKKLGDLITGNDATYDLTFTYNAYVSPKAPVNQLMENEVALDFNTKTHPTLEKDTDPTKPAIKTPSTSFKVHKVDGTNNNNITSDVTFELYRVGSDGSETLVQLGKDNPKTSATVNSEGIAEWTDLANGKYKLKEVKTKDGYRLLNKEIDVTIDNTDGSTTPKEITVKNYTKDTFIPNTGTLGAIGYIVSGSSLIVAAFATKKNKSDK